MTTTDETTLRRLRMRSMRRGMKEMDLILAPYADERLADLDAPTVALYETMLNENDQDLYQWITGQEAAPERYAALIEDISSLAFSRASMRNPREV